jgi:hypothetical protein
MGVRKRRASLRSCGFGGGPPEEVADLAVGCLRKVAV